MFTDPPILLDIERWSITIPLFDNVSTPYPVQCIDSLIRDIKDEFPDFTVLECRGNWMGDSGECTDQSLMFMIDLPGSEKEKACSFFVGFKERTAELLGQEEIYVTVYSAGRRLLLAGEYARELRKARQLHGNDLSIPVTLAEKAPLPALPAATAVMRHTRQHIGLFLTKLRVFLGLFH